MADGGVLRGRSPDASPLSPSVPCRTPFINRRVLNLVVAVTAVGLIAVAAPSLFLHSQGDDELLQASQAVSRRSVLGDGMMDNAWSDVWARKPAQFKAVSQELAGYDDLDMHIKTHASSASPLDSAQRKAASELSAYSQVLSSTMPKNVKASGKVKKAAVSDAVVWDTQQELADAAEHDKELKGYSNILSFSDQKQHKESRASSGKKAHAHTAKAEPAPTKHVVEKDVDELSRYDLLQFPAQTKTLHTKAQAAAAAKQEDEKEQATKAKEAATGQEKEVAAKGSKHSQTKGSAAAKPTEEEGKAKTAVAQESHTTKLLSTSSMPAQQQAGILIEPPPAGVNSPLARKWDKLWSEAQAFAKAVTHPSTVHASHAPPSPHAHPAAAAATAATSCHDCGHHSH
mmetsp:Transcript_18963/g.38645  ORF Transcript_18963/g.38645 Transcript_18963/m.38645 type:complete len:400 (-) Transcript_18963:168-1367(-)